MARYYVNKNAQPSGDHEVSKSDCAALRAMPPDYRQDLGEHLNCHSAVAMAKLSYRTANGCYYCCTLCHTS